MATVQENKEIIIKGFNDMKQGIANLEVSKVSVEELEPVAKAAYQDFAVWAPETQYTTGDIIYVLNRRGEKIQAKVLEDHTTSPVLKSSNLSWVEYFKQGKLQIIPSVGTLKENLAYGQLKGFTLDAFEIETMNATLWNFLGDWEELNEELKMSGSETNTYTEIVNILDNRIKSLEQSLNGVNEKLDTLLNSI